MVQVRLLLWFPYEYDFYGHIITDNFELCALKLLVYKLLA